MAGMVTIDFPDAGENSCVLRTTQMLCKVRGNAIDGNLPANTVYAQVFSTDPGAPPANYRPSLSIGCTPASNGDYNLDGKTFTNCSDIAANRWIWVTGEWRRPNLAPTYTTTAKQFPVICCDTCPTWETAALIAQLEDNLLSTAIATRGWSNVRCPANVYPNGTVVLAAESASRVERLGIIREVAVYAKKVAWRHNTAAEPSTIHSPQGTGISANDSFWLPGAPQQSIILWQPATGDHGPIAHVVTATRRRNPQRIAFDRRLPVFAQVNDIYWDGYANNDGKFTVVVRDV